MSPANRPFACKDGNALTAPATPQPSQKFALRDWLVDHGVQPRNARRFLTRSGCSSMHSMAVWLRFQLPPLHLANTDCVMLEMHEQLGITGKKATAIIKELNVVDCVNVDVHQEASVHLVTTGALTPASSGRFNSFRGDASVTACMSSDVVPEPHSFAEAQRTESQSIHSMRKAMSSQSGQHKHPSRMSGSVSSYDAWTPLGPGNPPEILNPGPHRVSSPATVVATGVLATRAHNVSTGVPPVSTQSASAQHCDAQIAAYGDRMHERRHLGAPMTVVEETPANSAWPWQMVPPVATGNRAERPLKLPNHQQIQRQVQQAQPQLHAYGSSHHQQRNRRAVGEGLEQGGAIQYDHHMHGEHALGAFDGKEAPDFAYALPAHASLDAAGLRSYESSASLRDINGIWGELSGPLGGTGRLGASRHACTGPLGGDSHVIASQLLPGVPTVSRVQQPGPYNQANAMLRQQMPHYQASVSVSTHWDQIIVWLLAIISVVTYIGIRGWYLLTGRTAALDQAGVSVLYSWMVLAAEAMMGVLGMYLHQNFWKQSVEFAVMPEQAMAKMVQEVKGRGITQTVHVLVTTYTEPAVTVRECVLRLLVAPEPIYMEKIIYVCDDGRSKSEGPKKKAMVEELRVLGHSNVFYVGDRIKRPNQLNGKSANLNHVLLRKIYPTVRKAEEVPVKDIFMVMDCDHMVKPEIFNKMGPCMLDERTAVCLAPQCFHNTIHPDALDAANGDFMFGKLPFYFGAGVLFVTGTNVMVRARSAFKVCRFPGSTEEATVDGEDHRQLFPEDEISEDVVLGSRLHAAGFKGVFVAENLATGEVPLEARAMWRQRFRWFKGGHLFLLSPTSVFFDKHKHMTLYHKSLYWICLVANMMSVYADPVLIALPFMCLALNVCVYGIDATLFWTHLMHAVMTQISGAYYSEYSRVVDSLKAHVAYRVLWFTTIKACINTVMVMTGWKKSGVFKATPKLGETADVSKAMSVPPPAVSARLPDVHPASTFSGDSSLSETGKASKSKFQLHRVHGALSKVTEPRRQCMPFDGTLDFWVIMSITGVTLFAIAMGVYDLLRSNSLLNFSIRNESLKWIAISWALHQCLPGLIFAGYLLTWKSCPGFLKFWVPFLTVMVYSGILFIEGRVAYAFIESS